MESILLSTEKLSLVDSRIIIILYAEAPLFLLIRLLVINGVNR